jgi:HEPN domain-containing protein
MTPEELRLDEASRWPGLAARDPKAALLLVVEEPVASVFHSQQGAEKSAKAFPSFHNVAFRKTHDLTELGKQCVAIDPSLTPLMTEAADLTEYAIVFRYLDAPREPDTAEANAALATANRLYDRVRALLA